MLPFTENFKHKGIRAYMAYELYIKRKYGNLYWSRMSRKRLER